MKNVTLAPYALDPHMGRRMVECEDGLTVAEIVDRALPGLPEAARERVCVTLVSAKGCAYIPNLYWHRVRPYRETHVVITIAPGGPLAALLIPLASSALASLFASSAFGVALAGVIGISAQTLTTIVALGFTIIGGLLLNALMPKPDSPKAPKPTYAISGWQNELRRDEPVPVPFGTMRYAPPFGATSYIEVVGDLIYNRAIFLWGLGPVELSDFKIGDTEISEFDELTIEHRYGYPDDPALTIYTNQVIEDRIGVEMIRELKRDDAGTPTGGYKDPKAVKRATARDCTYAIIILSFPSGLISVSQKGKKLATSVEFALSIRQAGTDTWTDLPNFTIAAKTQRAFYRDHRIDFPTRDGYEISLTRITPSEYAPDNKTSLSASCTWVVLQSFRPEYPINTSTPLAITAVRVKSSYQLTGGLDNFNGIVRRVCLDWDTDTSTWISRATRNPASAAIFAITGPALYEPISSDEIDWPAFEDWHDFCRTNGLNFDTVHDYSADFGEVLQRIGAAGRAQISHDGYHWTVIIDRPRQLVVDHINPQNSSEFSFSTHYFEPPQGLRVQFLDETNDYQQAERIVPWPGYEGIIDTTEQIELPGKTNPDEIYREARRRAWEMIYRNTAYSVTQIGNARTATRGDLVMASRDTLKRAAASARVTYVSGRLIGINQRWTFEDGKNYAIRFRTFDEEDTIGQSIVRLVGGGVGEFGSVVVTGEGAMPEVGDILHFGEADQDSYSLILTGIERGKNNSTVLTLLPSAEIIDELVAADPIPPWDGKVGQIIDIGLTPPLAPLISSVEVGSDGNFGTGNDGKVFVLLTDDPANLVAITSYVARWRGPSTEAGTEPPPPPFFGGDDQEDSEPDADGWVTVATSSRTILLNGAAVGDAIEFQVRAVALTGAQGDFSPIWGFIAGQETIPAAIPDDGVSVETGLGFARITFSSSDDIYTDKVQLYRDGVAIGSPLQVATSTEYSIVDGDESRANIIIDPGFDDPGLWTPGDGWTVAPSKAQASAGTASTLMGLRTYDVVAGQTLRVSFTVSGRTAGSVQAAVIVGANTMVGALSSANGAALGSIAITATGQASIGVAKDGSFNGSIDSLVAYVATPECPPQGAHSWELEPIGDLQAIGPRTAPVTGTVI